MVCPKQPLGATAFSGSAARSAEARAEHRGAARTTLRVLAAERLGARAGVGEEAARALGALAEAGHAVVRREDCECGAAPPAPCLVHRAGEKLSSAGSDAVVKCVHVEGGGSGVPRGCVALGEAARYNLRLAADQVATLAVFSAPPRHEFGLVDATLEVSRAAAHTHDRAEGGDGGFAAGDVQVDVGELAKSLHRRLFDRVLAVGELMLCEAGDAAAGPPTLLRVRVAEVNTLGEDEREEEPCYHCFRGRFQEATALRMIEKPGGGSGLRLACPGGGPAREEWYQQRGERATASGSVGARAAATRHATRVHVTTSDGEMFPIKKALLKPCIALTKSVRDSAPAAPEVAVDVDCATLDRVLLFLESEALGKGDAYDFPLTLLPDLTAAARALSLRPLAELCEARSGEFASRVREWSFDEVKRKNATGEVWLVLDGMVLDVTRWLPEHPGGSTIIPGQALNLDCSRFFEVYHASRESFTFLEHFYMGEVRAEDLPSVPQPDEPPSGDFLEQLRMYCAAFRLRREAAAHLGAA